MSMKTALHQISLIEAESSSSAAEKIRSAAKIARDAIENENENGVESALRDLFSACERHGVEKWFPHVMERARKAVGSIRP